MELKYDQLELIINFKSPEPLDDRAYAIILERIKLLKKDHTLVRGFSTEEYDMTITRWAH